MVEIKEFRKLCQNLCGSFLESRLTKLNFEQNKIREKQNFLSSTIDKFNHCKKNIFIRKKQTQAMVCGKNNKKFLKKIRSSL